ncbi:hypothetical protein K438DRAFT_2015238 [Mycena galopus ATCC 62051]|nr:hypothetical protein K438DRAFT_2015238 [Mycena galopus ATCC 62051]
MQCRLALAFIVSLLTIAVSAAPVADPNRHLILPREIDAPFVGMSEVAREPEPAPEAATETEETRGCALYTCI